MPGVTHEMPAKLMRYVTCEEDHVMAVGEWSGRANEYGLGLHNPCPHGEYTYYVCNAAFGTIPKGIAVEP